MASHISTIEGPSDAELISAVRGGDVDAFGELFARHVAAATRLARQLVSSSDADDLVSEAFAKVLVVLQRGGGPDLAFRAYLLTAVRRLQVDRIRSTSRLQTTGDLTPFDPGVPFRDTALERFESATAARAFASLPERWQLVLWHTEVEGQKPAEVALLLGISANSVSALAYRAREGLRQAYISMHAQDVDEDACGRARTSLGAYVRGGLSRRDAARVESHLEECRACAAIYLELTEVNSRLGALLAPLLLGTAAAAYVGATSGGVTVGSGTVTVLLGRARDTVATHAPTAAVAGVAASAVVGGLLLTIHQTDPDRPAAEDRPTVSSPAPADPTGGTEPVRRARDSGPRPGDGGPAAAVPSDRPSSPPSTAPTSGPTTGPTTGPTAPPTTEPTTGPTSGPSSGPTTPPSTPPPTTPPSTPPAAPSTTPAVQLGATVSAGPGGVGVGVTAGAAGLPPLPPISVSIPLPGAP